VKSIRVLGFVLFIFGFSSCSSAPKVVVSPRPWQKVVSKAYYQTSSSEFGKRIVIRIWPDKSAKTSPKEAAKLALAEIHRISTMADSGLSTSLLSKVNEHGYQEPVPITQEFLEILEISDKMYQFTDGKFDVTFVPIKYGSEESDMDLNKVTDWDEKPALSPNPIHLFGKKGVIIDKNPLVIRVYNRRTKINLNGMIRGYAIEKAAKLLQEKGHAGFAIIADGFFAAAGAGLKDPGIMCVEDPAQLGNCLKSIQPGQGVSLLFMGHSASLERRGINFDPTAVWSARSGGVLIAGREGAWVQFGTTISAVMDDAALIGFLDKAKRIGLSGAYFTPSKKDGLAGDLAPHAAIAP
jgi:thiamine biosynthesis lipoprotein ApbE